MGFLAPGSASDMVAASASRPAIHMSFSRFTEVTIPTPYRISMKIEQIQAPRSHP
jgi:hypothetical protein